jgi:hypothetical protein
LNCSWLELKGQITKEIALLPERRHKITGRRSLTSIAKNTVRYAGELEEEDFREGGLWEETI